MAAWEDDGQRRPARVDGRPARTSTTSRPAARSTTCCDDGSILAAGLRADQAHDASSRRRPTCKRSPPSGWSCSTTRTCRCGGPGRSIKGTCALTEFERRGRPGRRAGQEADDGEVRAAPRPTSSRPRRRWSRSSTTSRARRRVTGPGRVRHRRQGRDRLGHRRRPRPPQRAAQGRLRRSRSRSSSPAARELTFHLTQNHGGWNSDDNQNNNLGRFRLSVDRRRRRRRPTRCRRASASVLAIPRDQRTPAQVAAVFSYWRTTVPEWKEANDADRGAVEAAPGRHDAARARRRATSRATTHLLKRGDFLKPGEAGRRRACPAFLHPLPDGRAADAADVRPLAGRPRSRRRRRARSSTASGRRTSAPAWSPPARTSARRASRRSHPELLDWLAVEFMDSGWSLKQLHRLIVTSATYRQSSQVTPELLAQRPVQPAARARRRGSASTARSSATSRWPPAAC